MSAKTVTNVTAVTTDTVRNSFTPDPDYDLAPEGPRIEQKRGRQCGKCGIKFDYGVSYGYYCPNYNCPCGMGGS